MIRLKKIWNCLAGSPSSFSMESRTYHAACLISIIVLLGFLVVNLTLHLFAVLALTAAVLLLQLTFYLLSRLKGMFRSGVIGSAMVSYIALIINYYLNSGIDGPTLFIFFFTFNLLVIITPRSQHILWVVLHVVVVLGLIAGEYIYPDIFNDTYPTRLWRISDVFLTYLITLLFIYYVSNYLRNYYKYEKKLAESRAKALEIEIARSEKADAKLRAFFNSSSICHVLLDADVNIVDYNQAASEFIGKVHAKPIVLGSNMSDYLSSSYAQRFMEHFQTAIQGTTSFDELHIDYGTFSIWWSFKYEPAWDTKGNILGISFNGTNMNELKQQEIDIRDKNAALLKIAYIQSHELRAPVSSILGLMSIIKESEYKDVEECLVLMEKAVSELDEKIHLIVQQTKEL